MNVLLLDNRSTFDLCCNNKFTITDHRAYQYSHNDKQWGGLKITHECKIPGYKYPVWFSTKAITNINA